MQKYKNLVLFLSVSILFGGIFVSSVHADSGACSYHQGVNCSAGASSYGNAICNDGYESSVSYYSISECRVSCTPPTTSDCSVGGTSVQQNLYGMGNSISGQGEIKACSDAHIQYQAQLIAYNSCLSSVTNISPSYYSTPRLHIPTAEDDIRECALLRGTHAHVDNYSCKCDDGYGLTQTSKICTLIVKTPTYSCPADSFANIDSRGSYSCVTWNANCQKQYGPNTWGDENYCHVCSDGYQLNAEANACVPKSKQTSLVAPIEGGRITPIKASGVTPTKVQQQTYKKTQATSTEPNKPLKENTQSQLLTVSTSSIQIIKPAHWYRWLNPLKWFSRS